MQEHSDPVVQNLGLPDYADRPGTGPACPGAVQCAQVKDALRVEAWVPEKALQGELADSSSFRETRCAARPRNSPTTCSSASIRAGVGISGS